MSIEAKNAASESATSNATAPVWLIPWIVLALAAFMPVVGSLGSPFWYYDDRPMIGDSPIIRGEESLWSTFYKPSFSHYAPFHETLIYVQWHFFGDSPLPFRLVSFALHFLA